MKSVVNRSVALHNQRLLMLSNGRCHGQDYLEHAMPEITSFLGGQIKRILFLPFAKIALKDREPAVWDFYKLEIAPAFNQLGIEVDSLHEAKKNSEKRAVIENAEAIFIPGGNTWYLLNWLYSYGLLESLRAFVEQGQPVIGSSAGSNVLCANIRGTNDPRVADPPSVDAIEAVPFLIKPHFKDRDPNSTHMAESHEDQVREILTLHDFQLIGLREGTWLRVEEGKIVPGGITSVRVFLRYDAEPKEIEPGQPFEFVHRDRDTASVVASAA